MSHDIYLKYLEAIRHKVCAICIDRNLATGECGLPPWGKCAIERFYPEITEAVKSVLNSMNKGIIQRYNDGYYGNVDEYVTVLRKYVCVNCKNQLPDGTCILRDSAECGLNRYFPLIIEAIEEVEEMQEV
jgi:hypothetical protein